MKKKILLFSSIVLLVLLIVLTIVQVLYIEAINRIDDKTFKASDNEIAIIYDVYDSTSKDDIKALVTVSATNELEYVECPNDTTLYITQKNSVSLDYTFEENKNYVFKIKTKDNEEVEKTLTPTIHLKAINLFKQFDYLETGKTGTITATFVPATATNTSLTWSSSNTSVATVNSSGVVTGVGKGTTVITARNEASNISGELSITIKEVDPTVQLANGTSVTLTSSNIKNYIGTQVNYSCSGGGSWYLFYLDTNNKYGDGKNTVYIKRKADNSHNFTTSTQASYTSTTATNAMGKFNPLWKANDGVIDIENEHVCSYLCDSKNWQQYCNTSVALYAVGAPSLEMFCDSYNQYKGTLYYKFVPGEVGYSIDKYSNYRYGGTTSAADPTSGASDLYFGYWASDGSKLLMASPSRGGADKIIGKQVRYGYIGPTTVGQLNPVVALKDI